MNWIIKKKPKRTNQTLLLPSKAHGKVNEIIFIWASVNRALFICCCNTCPFKFYLSGVQLVSKTEKWTDEIRVYWQIGIVISSEALKDILICEIRKVYFSSEKKKNPSDLHLKHFSLTFLWNNTYVNMLKMILQYHQWLDLRVPSLNIKGLTQAQWLRP